MFKTKGSHGTTTSRADSIRRFGWLWGKGRGGAGIYFWKECKYYIILAVGWYKQCLAEGRYAKDSDSRCSIIIAELCAQDTETLDLDNRTLKERIHELAKKQGVDTFNTIEISGIYDLFVSELEKEMKVKYKIMTIEVASPKRQYCPEYSTLTLGFPICCIARDAKCININEIKTDNLFL